MMKENTFAVSLTLEDLKRRRLVIPAASHRWTRARPQSLAFSRVTWLDSSIRYSLRTIVTAGSIRARTLRS